MSAVTATRLKTVAKWAVVGVVNYAVVSDCINAPVQNDGVKLLTKCALVYKIYELIRKRKYFRAFLLSLTFFKFKINKRGNAHTVYQYITDYIRFGSVGHRLPPEIKVILRSDERECVHAEKCNSHCTSFMAEQAIKNGPWQRHLIERDFAEKLGSIFVLRGFNRRFFFVSDPDMVQDVLLDKETFPTRGETGITDLVGQGLLGLPSGEMHTNHRRVVGSFFSNKWLTQYAKVIEAETDILVDKWTMLCSENTESGVPQESNVTYDLGMLTLEVIMKACAGNNGEAVNQQFVAEKENYIQHALDNALKEVTAGTAIPFLKYFPSPSYKIYKTDYVKLWERVYTKAKEISSNPDAPLMILSALQNAKNGDGSKAMTDDEIYDEINTVRAAGHETTSNTLAWSLLLLYQNPDTMTKLQAEVDKVVKGKNVTFEESKQLPYTHMIIWEALRMYPTVPSFPREAVCHKEIGGYDIPKGSLVFISQNAMNKNPNIWPEPDTFRPERFEKLPELKPSKPVGIPDGHKFGFIPFGAGNRTCIGQRLAMLEAVQILGTIAKNFTWRLSRKDEPIVPVAEITLGPKNGLFMTFEKRT